METEDRNYHLPKLSTRASSVRTQSSPLALREPNRIYLLLRQAKGSAYKLNEEHERKQKLRQRIMRESQKIWRHAENHQSKRLDTENETPMMEQKQQQRGQTMSKVVAVKFAVKEIVTKWKPPHRYKTAMVVYQNNLVLYGGLGCEKEIKWASLSLSPLQWSFPPASKANHDYSLFRTPIYGHTMGVYKSNAYIYGGTCSESLMNELLILNLKTMEVTQGAGAPLRRKEHAMTFINRYMVIQGGLQGQNEVKNNIFCYDAEIDGWCHLNNPSSMPFLSHHGLVSTHVSHKAKRRINSFCDLASQALYIFGGRDINGEASNKLYKIKIKEDGDISLEDLIVPGGPEPRYSMCFQFLESGFLCVYGGKSTIQTNSNNKRNGVFNDIFLFELEKKSWVTPALNVVLGYRYGMSSFSLRGKILIFGGCEENVYANGNVLQLKYVEQSGVETSNYLDEENIKNLARFKKRM